MRMTLLISAIAVLAGTGAALAQFPPPGFYACTAADGTAIGAIFLAPDGDYQFTAADGTMSKGQMASAGTDVRALSGPLFDDYHLTGAFETNALGDTHFAFTSDKGAIACGPPPA
jgi:hypothetical protein